MKPEEASASPPKVSGASTARMLKTSSAFNDG